MQLKSILNKCHKFKSFVFQSVQYVAEPGKFEVQIVPRKGNKPTCSVCQKPSSVYDTQPPRRFEFIPLWGFPVFFVYSMRRVNCPTCGVKVEQVPWAKGKHELTLTYMQHLAGWAKKLSWLEVARQFQTSWDKVFDSVRYVVKWGLENRDLTGICAIGVDEIARQKGHKYLSLVYQIDQSNTRLLWIGNERTSKSFNGFFDMLGTEKSAQIQFICSDMWKPYLKVIRERASQALHVLDRFHIVAMLNKAIDKVRSEEQPRLKSDGFEPLLKNSRWCLLKRPENLTDKQEVKLTDLLRYNLKSVRAYLLKEDFDAFWGYISSYWAGRFLDRWATRVMRSKIEPMKKVAKTIRVHRPLILNYFKAKKTISNGVVEGLNNKAKVTTRKSYGFKSVKCQEIALYHALGRLPSPPVTHRFY